MLHCSEVQSLSKDPRIIHGVSKNKLLPKPTTNVASVGKSHLSLSCAKKVKMVACKFYWHRKVPNTE